MSDNIPLFPVTGWDIHHVPSMDVIMLRLPFLASPLQRPAEADPGRHYGLTPPQARELAHALLAAADQTQSDADQPTPPLNG